jgi:hypothetical protein
MALTLDIKDTPVVDLFQEDRFQASLGHHD